MDPREFVERLKTHARLSLATVRGEGDDVEIVIIADQEIPTGQRTAWTLPFSEISLHSWDELEAVFLGRREPRIISQFTRIVGYYSQVRNWNRSKLAELRDRHKGNYALTV